MGAGHGTVPADPTGRGRRVDAQNSITGHELALRHPRAHPAAILDGACTNGAAERLLDDPDAGAGAGRIPTHCPRLGPEPVGVR